MEYGYFDDARREYIITNPRTPTKWINYIGTLAFGGFVDQTGGALICSNDPALNRITKYITQMPASDFKGETLYLRIKRDGKYEIFSPFFVPTLAPYDRYECHVGLGYTRIVSEFFGVCTEVTIFVPTDAAREIRDLQITNLTREPIEIDVIPVVEYTHPDALKQLTNADWVPQTMQSRAMRDNAGRVILVQYPFMLRDSRINFFASNHAVSSFETDRKNFLGENEYGTWAHPKSLQLPELSDTQALRGDNIAALLHHLGNVSPNETRRLITQLGQADKIENELERIDFWRDPKQVDTALQKLAQFWDRYLATMHVETPDANLNRMLNIHNPRQCHTTKNWSRYLSYYQLGYGSRGIGFRDSSQDVLAVIAAMPNEAKELVRQLLSVQKPNGSAMHQFNPLTMIASEGDSLEREDRPHYYSDDHLWIVLAVCAYLKETGDWKFLDEAVPFYNAASASVLTHLHRALEFTHGDVGAHGLPLLGFADWNDTVNLAKGAESLFTANLYGKALREMIDLVRYLGDEVSVEKYWKYHDEMRTQVNDIAWDGEWYVSYFDGDGTPIGSRTNAHGQIYAHAQPWAIIAGFASSERARTTLDSVRRKLNTRHGIKLSTPGFDGFDPRHGGITTYPPGAKENGGIFLHTNPWIIIAETLVGNGDRAFEYYNQINPVAKNDRIDEFECEPYVYPQNILGDEHPQFGLARNSWLSGTAAWMYVAGTQYILGIRPTFDGLQIAPEIPRAWKNFSVTRVFRNVTYNIDVERMGDGNSVSLVVDGKAIEGNIVPLPDRGQIQVHVKAMLR
ncbi:MAG: glycosyl transferase [Chloroflexi bacterium]|nr:glycosyl transferase [Chloroflexota bacterium]